MKKGLIMLGSKPLISDASATNPRADLGVWLKSLREACGLSQRQMATMLSLDYYTFISQLENGRGKIPSSRYLDWAQALNQDPRSFVKSLLSHYDPVTYGILFDTVGAEVEADRDAAVK